MIFKCTNVEKIMMNILMWLFFFFFFFLGGGGGGGGVYRVEVLAQSQQETSLSPVPIHIENPRYYWNVVYR